MALSLKRKALSLTGLFMVYTCTMIVVFAMALGSYMSLRTTVEDFESITERELVELRRLFYLQDVIRLSSAPISQYVAWGNRDEGGLFDNNVSEVEEAFSDVLAMSSVRENQLERILTARTVWRQAADVGRALFAIPSQEKEDLRSAENMYYNLTTASINTLYEAHNIRIAETLRNKEEATRRHRVTQIVTAVTFFGGLLFFAFASYVLAHHIIKPLRKLRDGILRIGAGDLSTRIDLQVENELGELARGINAMADSLVSDQVALEQLAIRDSLTDLYNRREFERLLVEELHRAARYYHPLSLLLIDIDRFKQINDGFGHRAGDQALRMVSAAIRDISRKGDIVGRYGGDELAVLMPETPIDDAVVVAERIRALASQQLTANDGSKIDITLSIGVANTDGDITSSEKLIDAADQAMYVAKAEGRNCVRRADAAGGAEPQRRLPMAMP